MSQSIPFATMDSVNGVKHTPGPWKAIKAAHGPIDIFDARDRDVVTVYGGGVGESDREANARLIAAAPELLEALDAMLGAFAEGVIWNDEQRAAYEGAAAVIAKATAS